MTRYACSDIAYHDAIQVLASEQEKKDQPKLTILGIWQEMVQNLKCAFCKK